MFYIVYHDSDFDGKCSAAIFLNKLLETTRRENIVLFPFDYGYDIPKVSNNDTVYLLDMSFDKEDMVYIRDKVGIDRFIWIDHHDTAIKKYESLGISGRRDLKYAACELCWFWVYSNSENIPISVTYLGRYDVWDHKDDNVVPFELGMRTLRSTEPSDSIWPMIFKCSSVYSEPIKSIILRGCVLKDFFDNGGDFTAKKFIYKSTFDGMDVLVTNKGGGSKIFDSYPNKEQFLFFVCYNRTNQRRWKVSLFSSREDIHVGEIAKKYGGGGHKSAAGFTCDRLPFEY